MDLQVDASQRKFAKPELMYKLVMGGQTDSQLGSQVHTSHKKVVNFKHRQLSCDQIMLTCVGWPNTEKLVLTCTRI